MNTQNSTGNKSKTSSGKSTKSNTIRSIFFTIFSILFIVYCLNLFSSHNLKIKEVPLSDVIARANDENGNIKKITVSGSELEILSKTKIFQPRFPEKMHPALSMNKDSSTTAPINPVKI